MHGFRSHKKHKPDHKKNAIGWGVLILGLVWFAVAFGQSTKNWFYKPDGTIAGWAERIPGGNKQALYDRHGNRVGTYETAPSGLPAPQNSNPYNPFQPPPSESTDPFAEVPDDE